MHHGDDGRSLEGKAASGCLVENAAKREQVGPAIEFLAADLFRRHIEHGPTMVPGVVGTTFARVRVSASGPDSARVRVSAASLPD
jgi:hypothetical protein